MGTAILKRQRLKETTNNVYINNPQNSPRYVYTTNGSFTVPITGYYTVLCIGGGGGGGVGETGGTSGLPIPGGNGGGGGGGGAYSSQQFYLSAGSQYVITIGQGGIGGLPQGQGMQTNGGNSSFGALLTSVGGAYGVSGWNIGGAQDTDGGGGIGGSGNHGYAGLANSDSSGGDGGNGGNGFLIDMTTVLGATGGASSGAYATDNANIYGSGGGGGAGGSGGGNYGGGGTKGTQGLVAIY